MCEPERDPERDLKKFNREFYSETKRIGHSDGYEAAVPTRLLQKSWYKAYSPIERPIPKAEKIRAIQKNIHHLDDLLRETYARLESTSSDEHPGLVAMEKRAVASLTKERHRLETLLTSGAVRDLRFDASVDLGAPEHGRLPGPLGMELSLDSTDEPWMETRPFHRRGYAGTGLSGSSLLPAQRHALGRAWHGYSSTDAASTPLRGGSIALGLPSISHPSEAPPALQQKVSTPLGEDQIKHIAQADIKIVRYPDLDSVPSWDALTGGAGGPGAAVLFCTTSPTAGHWLGAWTDTSGRAHVFDPLGYGLDQERKRLPSQTNAQLDQKDPEFSLLLKKSGAGIAGCKVSRIDFQQDKPGIDTCGRWVGLRLKHRNLSDDEFARRVKAEVAESGLSPDAWICTKT